MWRIHEFISGWGGCGGSMSLSQGGKDVEDPWVYLRVERMWRIHEFISGWGGCGGSMSLSQGGKDVENP